MKKFTILSALLCLITLTSCQKSGLNLFRGDYSYKTTGNVTVNQEIGGILVDSLTFKVNLNNEIGQVQISTMDKKEDRVVVMMNAMNGDVIVANATVDDDKIVFDDFKREIQILNFDPTLDLKFEVNVHAEGKMYDDNMMIVNMTYDGEKRISNKTLRVNGSDITMAAQRN